MESPVIPIKPFSNKVGFRSITSFKAFAGKFSNSKQDSMRSISKYPHAKGENNSEHQEFEGIKKKHDKIATLESEIASIQKKMTDFYYKMKEVLLKDPTLSRELKEVFFSDALREQILQCDSITMIDFLQKIIVGAVDLSHNMMEGITFTTNFKENDQDYVIILQKLEEEIVLLKQQQIQDEFIIDSLKAKIEELQDHNKRIVEKSAQTAQSFKQDYYKLLTIIHELEYDIVHLKETISEKEANIQALNEKNFSIYVLEHKIKALEQKYRKDFSKAKAKFNKEVLFIKDTRISNPNFFQRMHTIDSQVKELETQLYSSKAKTQKIEGVSKIQINEIIEEKTTLENTINSLNNEVIDLKERVAEKNKEIFFLKQENIRKNELIEMKCTNVSALNKNFDDNNIRKIGKSLNNTTFNKTLGNR